MYSAFVRPDGTIQLGPEAKSAGYLPGTVVNILVTRAGSLILSPSDEPAMIEVTPALPVRTQRRRLA